MRSKKVRKTAVIPLKKPKQISLLVGLTGGVGTGKSTVADYFSRLGAQVIDSDKLAHQALKPGTPTYDAICDHFGRKKILGSKGLIDRKKLGAIIFNRPAKRKILESVVHPYVFGEIEKAAKKKKGILVLEVPLLFETHFNEKMDVNIVVSASRARQVERLKKRSGMTSAEVSARIKAQMPLSKKEALADFLVNNNGTKTATKKQVSEIWNNLSSRTALRTK